MTDNRPGDGITYGLCIIALWSQSTHSWWMLAAFIAIGAAINGVFQWLRNRRDKALSKKLDDPSTYRKHLFEALAKAGRIKPQQERQ